MANCPLKGRIHRNALAREHEKAGLGGLLDADETSDEDETSKTDAVIPLAGANLTSADLTKMFLVQANLGGANLSKACLSNANLAYADLRDATLSNAILSGTR
jgi:hypothetical protein